MLSKAAIAAKSVERGILQFPGNTSRKLNETAVKWASVPDGPLQGTLYFEYSDGSLLQDSGFAKGVETSLKHFRVLRSRRDKKLAKEYLNGPPSPWPMGITVYERLGEDMKEAQLLCAVQEIAHWFGWAYFSAPIAGLSKCANGRGGGYGEIHRYGTQRPIGFPDIVLIRAKDGLRINAELKSQSGKLQKRQRELHERWQANHNPCVVWRPSDWPEIMTALSGQSKRRHTLECPCPPCSAALDNPVPKREWSDGSIRPAEPVEPANGGLWRMPPTDYLFECVT